MIERNFDVSFIAELALREKQIQQNYRPFIAIHKWFARRPGTLFRGILLSEFINSPVSQVFFQSHQLNGVRIADPFMGGGTPLLEANRIGCDTIGYDINPMSHWIVKQVIEYTDLTKYRHVTQKLRTSLESNIGSLYRTRCTICQSAEAHVKYFLWVKVQYCSVCGNNIDLFPGYLISKDKRHPKNVFVCPHCGELKETISRKEAGFCSFCGQSLSSFSTAKRGSCQCPSCGSQNKYPNIAVMPPRHRLFAIEYYCTNCKPQHKGRFFKKPDKEDLTRFCQAEAKLKRMRPRFVPDDKIPPGDETSRLHRWGYQRFSDMFNARQLIALELSCRFIASQSDKSLRNALATNLSDLLRYQNMLCRYDTMALKSLDIFSVHGFPVGLIQCESNFLGIPSSVRGVNIGSGGWSNIIEKYTKGKAYCYAPFEIRYHSKRKLQVHTRGEWIGVNLNAKSNHRKRKVSLFCRSATKASLKPNSLDAVLTDPPYFDNVQYAELMDFCYVWLRKLIGEKQPVFKKPTTRDPQELTGNKNMCRGLDHFANGISTVFQKMAIALKSGAPLVFTYHHNKLEAYLPIGVALLDASLVCSASLPCPAEMGASIHIRGMGSSIVDTVFVCRSTGHIPQKWLVKTPEGVAVLVENDLLRLRAAGMTPTQGDIRCITFGHLIRIAVWYLRKNWKSSAPINERIQAVEHWVNTHVSPEEVLRHVDAKIVVAPILEILKVSESFEVYGVDDDAISF